MGGGTKRFEIMEGYCTYLLGEEMGMFMVTASWPEIMRLVSLRFLTLCQTVDQTRSRKCAPFCFPHCLFYVVSVRCSVCVFSFLFCRGWNYLDHYHPLANNFCKTWYFGLNKP